MSSLAFSVVGKVPKPRVTMIVVAFNQQRFIAEAVRSALSQRYENLQIIVSDDCSGDQTFQIMQDVVGGYDGRHAVLLNRNSTNLGLAGHINLLMSMADGDLVVAAAGDDVSVSERVEALVAKWIECGMPDALCSDCHSIDEEGKVLDKPQEWIASQWKRAHTVSAEEFIAAGGPALIGCTEAWTRNLFLKFGPLDESVTYEDHALSLRAYLLGGIAYIDKKLVYYRQHSGNLCNARFIADMTPSGVRQQEMRFKVRFEREACLKRGMQRDIECAVFIGVLDRTAADRINKRLAAHIRACEAIVGWWDMGACRKLSSLLLMARLGSRFLRLVWWGVFRFSSLEFFCAARSTLSSVKRMCRSVWMVAS